VWCGNEGSRRWRGGSWGLVAGAGAKSSPTETGGRVGPLQAAVQGSSGAASGIFRRAGLFRRQREGLYAAARGACSGGLGWFMYEVKKAARVGMVRCGRWA
jgi:hypothetical protein